MNTMWDERRRPRDGARRCAGRWRAPCAGAGSAAPAAAARARAARTAAATRGQLQYYILVGAY